MATLTSTSKRMMCEISPLKPEFHQDSKWIETRLCLQTEIMGRRLALAPWRNATVMQSDFRFFIEGVRDFVNRLKQRPSDSDPLQPFCPFVFTPLELDFEFSCLEGEYDDDNNGEVAIRFMMNHINPHSTTEQIGYTTEVDVKELGHFLDTLEYEVGAVIN